MATATHQPSGARPVRVPVAVVGGGQAGLAAAYYLRRAKVDFVVLDAQGAAGGAWRNMWDSLHLFSPAAYSPPAFGREVPPPCRGA